MIDREKMQAADRLLDAIGYIDDRIVYDASMPYRKKQSSRSFRSMIILAATLSVFASLLITSLAIGLLRGGDKKNDAFDNENENNAPVTDTLVGNTLAVSLENLRYSTEANKCAPDDLDLLDGKAKLVWKYSDEQFYRVCVLDDENDLIRLEKKLEKGSTDLKNSNGQQIESPAVSVWICRPDGSVISPCLRLSDGNVSYGSLFDYDPELEPSKDFTSDFCDLIG